MFILNEKGLTLVELIASLILISIMGVAVLENLEVMNSNMFFFNNYAIATTHAQNNIEELRHADNPSSIQGSTKTAIDDKFTKEINIEDIVYEGIVMKQVTVIIHWQGKDFQEKKYSLTTLLRN